MVVASGQVESKEGEGVAPIYVWDSGCAPWPGGVTDADAHYPLTPATLGVLRCDTPKLHTDAVGSLEFSADGLLLCSVGRDQYRTAAIWDWDDGYILTTVRVHNAPLYSMRFNPYQFLGLAKDPRDPQPGEACIDDAEYCLVSCGKAHIKFWVLHRVLDPELRKPKTVEKGTIPEPPPVPTKSAKNKNPLELLAEEDKANAGKSRCAMGRDDLIWRLDGSSGNLCKRGQLQDFTCLTFVDDSAPMWRRNDHNELEACNKNDHTLGRVIAGTRNGDLYVWHQPRVSPMAPEIGLDEADAQLYFERFVAATEPGGSGLPKAWEQALQLRNIEVVERIKWRSSGKLIHNVPANKDAGNMFCLGLAEQSELARCKRELKIRPRDAALKEKIAQMGYAGPIAHKGGVHAITFNPVSRQLLSAGGDGTLSMWQVNTFQEASKRPAVKGVAWGGSAFPPKDFAGDNHNSINKIDGATINLRSHVPLVDIDSGTENVLFGTPANDGQPLGPCRVEFTDSDGKIQTEKLIVKSMYWNFEDDRAVLGLNTNTIAELNTGEDNFMEFEVLSRAHTGRVWGVAAHPKNGNVFATTSEDQTVRVWSCDPAYSHQDHTAAGRDRESRRCLCEIELPEHVDGRSCAWHPEGALLAVGTSAGEPVEILQNTFSDQTRCIAPSYGPDPHSCGMLRKITGLLFINLISRTMAVKFTSTLRKTRRAARSTISRTASAAAMLR